MFFRRRNDPQPPQDLKLVAGLGNIGAPYRHTRHNVGFEVVDELASFQARCRSVYRGDTRLSCQMVKTGEQSGDAEGERRHQCSPVSGLRYIVTAGIGLR